MESAAQPPNKKLKTDTLIDSSVIGLLRPHQVSAAEFILSKLFNGIDSSDHCPFPLTGAILADEMGTGKTLVGIAVLLSICKRNSCKAVVVCPPILICNWLNEIRKWLPSVLGNKVSSVSGTANSAKKNDLIVRDFVTSHASVQPLLIIGYEMFRTYAEALNTCSSLEVLICDEGHRLKNAEGTKTIQALERCCATRRLVLTGTPIQNNLEELFAVVHFVVPGYLGSLKEFKTTFQDPIMRAKDPEASDRSKRMGAESESRLRGLLSGVLLRRTKEMVLSTLLPPRHEFTVRLSLSEEQRDQYRALALELLLSSAGGGGGVTPSSSASSSVDLLLSSLSSSVSGSQRIDSFKGILPGLLNLRMVCDRANKTDDEQNEKQEDRSNGSESRKESAQSQLESLLSHSSKLQALDSLVAAIFAETSKKATTTDSSSVPPSSSSSCDRVVIVSSFTSVLDQVQTLCRLRQWRALKIDGAVTAERRMTMIQHFNNPKGVFSVMLLSARAGGAGINLIGGNRLILLEPDWNPAVDQQAMGRVWRDGQTREVFIYRLVSRGTIEEAIRSRQMDKSSLSSVIKEEGVGGENDDESETGESSASSSAALEQLSSNLTVAGLKALILPDSNEEENCSGCECVSVDPALQTFVKNSGPLRVTVSRIE